MLRHCPYFLVIDLVVLSAVLGLQLGDHLLKNLVERELSRWQRQFGLEISLAELTLPKPNAIHIQSLSIHHTKVNIDLQGLKASFTWFDLLVGRLKPEVLVLDDIRVTLLPDSSAKSTQVAPQYFGRIEQLQQVFTSLAGVIHRLPDNLIWHRLEFYHDSSFILKSNSGRLEEREGTFKFYTAADSFKVKLTKNSERLKVDVVAGPESFNVPSPLDRYVEKLTKSTLELYSVDSRQIELKFSAEGLVLRNRHLHTQALALPKVQAHASLHISDSRFLEANIDWVLGRLSGETRMAIQENEEYEVDSLNLQFNIMEQSADTWFTALPQSAFRCLPSLGLSGELGLRFEADFKSGRSIPLVLNCKVLDRKLRLDSGGGCELGKLKGSFVYRPWGSYRKLLRGLEAVEGYTTLEQISPLLRAAVLNAEDGGFFWHRGFNPEALAESVLDNLKQGYFKRGGSTISMQLVKNVFLGREKTFVRKFEELALTWLIEHFRLCSKERMLEQYLNLIEWGPEVYGIAEAADYYFNKTPSQLTALESIFLASIIPAPRAFRYRFYPKSDTLRDFNASFFQLIGRKLVQQKYLNLDELAQLDYRQLRLKGEALRLVIRENNSADTSKTLLPEMDWINLLQNSSKTDSLTNSMTRP